MNHEIGKSRSYTSTFTSISNIFVMFKNSQYTLRKTGHSSYYHQCGIPLIKQRYMDQRRTVMSSS